MAEQPTALIEARGICLAYGDRQVLDQIDIAVNPGEVVTLMGLNGAGKSTLVRVLLGLTKADSGSVWRRDDLRIGYSPQHIHRDPTMPMTVSRFLTLGQKADKPSLTAILREVGVEHTFSAQLSGLSGGELHRVLLARALLRQPELLVLDEPMAGVDVAGQTELYRLIADIRDRRGCGVLMVSHDLHVVMAATDRVVCIDGHICCTGHPETVATHPEFVSLFGKHIADSLAIYTHSHDHRHTLSGEVCCDDHDGHKESPHG